MEVIKDEGLVARASYLGDQLRSTLGRLQRTYPRIADIRGLGAMLGVEFNDPKTGAPDPDFAKRVQAKALEEGLLLLTCGVHFNVIRFLMPLTIPDVVFAEALRVLGRSVESASA